MKYIKTFESKEISFFEIEKEESWPTNKNIEFNVKYADLIIDLFTKKTLKYRFRSFRSTKNTYNLILTLFDGLSTYSRRRSLYLEQLD
jgi:hypothetical protein